MNTPEIGQSVRRHEDLRFLTGAGTYIDDIVRDGMAYAVVVRSSEAHAVIAGIDTSAAAEAPGVLLIVTGKDWAAEGFGPIPNKSAVNKNADGSPYAVPLRHCLPAERVRFVGEPVAMVVAETATAARDAAEQVVVSYEPLTSVTDLVAAAAEGAPQIWDDIPGNLCIDFELGDKEGTDAAFADADHVVTLEVANNRVTAVPIEPRGAVASYDAESDSYELWNASQNIHANRATFAENILKIPADKLHHVAPDVGGGFGGKNGTYPEPAVLLYAAKRLGRTVKWVNDRGESFLSDTHGRGQVSRVELALDKDGTFRALRTDTIGDLGAYCGTVGPFTPTGGSARTQGGPYAFGAMHYRGRGIFTNTAPLDPYRGAGRPEATFQVERVIEHAARELGFDPVELRRRNLMPPESLPLKTAMGLDVDSGNFPEVVARTLALTDREGFAARVAASAGAGRRRGFAIAPYLECTGGMPKEYAGVVFETDGGVRLSVGSHSTGMGHETSLPQILAAELGLDFDAIHFVQADTDATPLGGGHGGSRGLEVGGSAVLQAAGEVLEKARVIAAHLLEAELDDIDFAGGTFTDAGSGRSVAMAGVIEASFDADRLPANMSPGCLDTSSVFERGMITIPNGCHAAEVEVDPETGVVEVVGYWVVDDFGTVINPLLADGQVMGGVVQGIGQALMEEIVYDRESGQLVTGSLMDYALPRADHIPSMEIDYYEDAPTQKNPLGVKGAGEAGCVGAPPAIVNAVLDALKDDGVRDLTMPLTPERVWRAIRDASA